MKRRPLVTAVVVTLLLTAGCKPRDPPPNVFESQKRAMDRSKEVGKTMQKAVDDEAAKADADGK